MSKTHPTVIQNKISLKPVLSNADFRDKLWNLYKFVYCNNIAAQRLDYKMCEV